MKYFFDTEFIDDGKTIELISIGIACEDGREFYAENLSCDTSKASAWVKENVLPHLWRNNPKEGNAWSRDGGHGGLMRKNEIASEVKRFCNTGTAPEFWAYYCSYDWVAFCQLFGTMIELPEGFPMYCRDVKQECDRLGNPELPAQESTEHHALNDARWTYKVWQFLQEVKSIAP